MPAISINGIKILFLHIPKTGGYSIELFMHSLSQEFGNGKIDFWSPRKGVCAKCTPQHYTREILEMLLEVDCFDAIFTVTRNPLQKLLSEYRWRVFMGDKSTAPGFSEWYKKCRIQYKRDKYIYDNHFRHQADFLMEKSKIFKLEDGLNRVSEYLLDVCNITDSRRSAFSLKPTHKYTWDQILSKQGVWARNAYEKRRPSDEDIDLIKADYSTDYRLLGYSLSD